MNPPSRDSPDIRSGERVPSLVLTLALAALLPAVARAAANTTGALCRKSGRQIYLVLVADAVLVQDPQVRFCNITVNYYTLGTDLNSNV